MKQFDIIKELSELRLISTLIPFLDLQEFKNLRLVNRSYNSIITKAYKVDLLIKLNSFNFWDEVSNIGNVGSLFGQSINKVTVAGLVKNSKLFTLLGLKFVNLTELNLIEVKLESSVNQLNQLIRLKALKIKNLSKFPNNHDNEEVFNLKLPQLEKLSLEYTEKSKCLKNFILPDFSKLSNLTCLTIKLDKVNNLPIFYDETNKEKLWSDSLNYLHLELEGNLNQLQYINYNLPRINNLKILKLRSILNNDIILQELSTCKVLEKLQLNLCELEQKEELFKILFRNRNSIREFKLNTEIQLEDYFNQLIFCDLLKLEVLSCFLTCQPNLNQIKNPLPNAIELSLPNTILNLDLLKSGNRLVKLECLSLEVVNLACYPKLKWLKYILPTNGINNLIESNLIGSSSWIWLRDENLVNGSVIGIRINN